MTKRPIASNASTASDKQIRYILSLRNQLLRTARRTDPTTCHTFRRPQDVTEQQALILQALNTHGPMTDTELETLAMNESWPQASKGYYRRRRSELRSAGLVVATKERRPNDLGNTETVWRIATNDDDVTWAFECDPGSLTSRQASKAIQILLAAKNTSLRK